MSTALTTSSETTGFWLIFVMMSPLARPATSAGNPRWTPITRTPVSSWSWFSRANARETFLTPIPHVSDTHSSPIRLSVAGERPDFIIHTAAQPSHDKAASIPYDDFDVNAVGTMNMLVAARDY